MPDKFRPLSPRVGAETTVRRDEIMAEAESRTFIEKLSVHTTRPENVYHHDWEIGDMVIWDNCGTMHQATPYDPASGRMMHRTVLLGTESIA
jgi:alpha-ketoglutarate-dependent taurine dioxygenase